MLKLPRILLGLAALAAAFAIPPAPADAARVLYCAPSRAGVAAGPARWTAPTSGTSYSLNARGCAALAATDIADAVAAGFVQPGGLQSVTRTNITTSASGNDLILPAGATIIRIVAAEVSGAAVTGNLEIGTTNGGSEVCCASAQGFQAGLVSPSVSDAQLKKNAFSDTGPTTLYVDTSGAFGSGALAVTIFYALY